MVLGELLIEDWVKCRSGSQAFTCVVRLFFQARVELAAADRLPAEQLYRALLALQPIELGDLPVRTEWLYLFVQHIIGRKFFYPNGSSAALRAAIDRLPYRRLFRAIRLLRTAGGTMDRFSLVRSADRDRSMGRSS